MSKKEDFRKLSLDAQASMRRVALKLIKRGEKQSSVADVIGVSRQTISEWVSKNRKGDKYAISGKPRGRKTGDRRYPRRRTDCIVGNFTGCREMLKKN